MSDILPPNYFDHSLQRSAMAGDPLQFFLQEDVILSYYHNRIPKLRPTSMFTGEFDDWQRRRATLKQIKDMIEQHHLNLMQAVLLAQVGNRYHQATYLQRELEWTEHLRRSHELNEGQFNFQLRVRQMEEVAQRVRDERLHGYTVQLQQMKQDHDLAMKNAGIVSPVQRVNDMQQVSDKLREMLVDIHNSDYPERVKNQWAGVIIKIGQSSLT